MRVTQRNGGLNLSDDEPITVNPYTDYIATATCLECKGKIHSDTVMSSAEEAVSNMVQGHMMDTRGRCSFISTEANTTIHEPKNPMKFLKDLRQANKTHLSVIEKLSERRERRKLYSFAIGKCKTCEEESTSDLPKDSEKAALQNLSMAHIQDHGHWFQEDKNGVRYLKTGDVRAFMEERARQAKYGDGANEDEDEVVEGTGK